jgi:hypothetical protein
MKEGGKEERKEGGKKGEREKEGGREGRKKVLFSSRYYAKQFVYNLSSHNNPRKYSLLTCFADRPGLSAYNELNRVSHPPILQKVTVFGDRVFKE